MRVAGGLVVRLLCSFDAAAVAGLGFMAHGGHIKGQEGIEFPFQSLYGCG